MSAIFEPLFASGRIIDLVLLLVGIEAALLGWLGPRLRRPRLLRSLAPTLLAGALLLVTLRLALGGAWWGWIALALILALVAHVIDLALRWPPRRDQG